MRFYSQVAQQPYQKQNWTVRPKSGSRNSCRKRAPPSSTSLVWWICITLCVSHSLTYFIYGKISLNNLFYFYIENYRIRGSRWYSLSTFREYLTSFEAFRRHLFWALRWVAVCATTHSRIILWLTILFVI